MKYYEADEDLSGPILKVQEWIQEAENNAVALPHAMNISTINLEGKPSSRMVLLKRISNEGLVFFTDYEGHKGQQITASPHVALTFWWAKTNKQIRIEGECSKVSKRRVMIILIQDREDHRYQLQSPYRAVNWILMNH